MSEITGGIPFPSFSRVFFRTLPAKVMSHATLGELMTRALTVSSTPLLLTEPRFSSREVDTPREGASTRKMSASEVFLLK